MNRSSTERARRWLLAIVAIAPAVAASAQEWRGSSTPGVTLHDPSEHFGDVNTIGWFEQWESMIHKKSEIPWFLDLLHSDLGYVRDDDTWLFRIERWSPFAYGEHTLADLDWRGLRISGQAHRFRTGDLRWMGFGTGDTGAPVLPALGSHWNDDSAPNDRFFTRRYGGGGEIRIRPEDFGYPDAPLTQFTFYGNQEMRTGQQQELFLLDVEELGHGPQDARWRGRTGSFDQEVTTLGGRFVAVPFGLATTVLDLSWQGFRELAPTATVADVAAIDPRVQPGPQGAEHTLFFVPDTDRLSAVLKVSRRIGDATLHGGAFATRLAQTGTRTPQQNQDGLEHNQVTTFATHGAADVPINDWLGFDAYGTAAYRTNDLDRDTALFGPDNRTQIAPFLRELRDVRGSAEFIAQPMPGARVATGFRIRDLDRDLDYASTIAADGLPERAIRPPFSLVRAETLTYATYLRAHARLLRRTRVSGEVGYAWSPVIGMPTDVSHGTYAEGRISQSLRAPVPLTASLFGHWRNGTSSDYWLNSAFVDRSQIKDYEQRVLDWGASVTALPAPATTLYLTFTQQQDRQDFPHVRSNVPRPNGERFLRFYLDSELGWHSDVRVLAFGGTQRLSPRVEASLGGWFTFARGTLPHGGSTAAAIQDSNEIDLTQTTLEAAIGMQVRNDLHVGIAYRFDRFHNAAPLNDPNLDGHDHSVTLSATYDFAFAGH